MTLAIRLNEDMEWRLTQLSEKTGRTKAFYVRQALEAYLEEMEERYLDRVALERLRDPAASYFSLDEVVRELNLEHPNRKKGAKKPGKARSKGAAADHRLSL